MFDSAVSGPPRRRRPINFRTGVVLGGALALILVTGVAAAMTLVDDPARSTAAWRDGPASADSLSSPQAGVAAPATTPSPEAGAADTISLSATGDIIMGDAPASLPPNGGKGYFDAVKQALASDLPMGNLEEPLTDETGYVKCGQGSTACHQFRAPPGYAAHLREAGFKLLNLANNHAWDFGPEGHRNTQRALEQNGLAHTGDPDEITVVTVRGITVAVLGFSSYSWSNSLLDIASAKAVVQKAAGKADLVVVQVHMGGEGADKTHVRPGTENFLGENRGDPIRFAHAVIDAGADLVVGHGPHVMRALEFYQGRLIAYSLGNFTGGGGTLNSAGVLGYGAVLKVSLRRDGSWVGGSFVSTTTQGAGGLPRMDPNDRGAALVRSLCQADFPRTGARIGSDDKIGQA